MIPVSHQLHVVKWTKEEGVWYLVDWGTDPTSFRWTPHHENAKRFPTDEAALAFVLNRLGERKNIDIEATLPRVQDIF